MQTNAIFLITHHYIKEATSDLPLIRGVNIQTLNLLYCLKAFSLNLTIIVVLNPIEIFTIGGNYYSQTSVAIFQENLCDHFPNSALLISFIFIIPRSVFCCIEHTISRQIMYTFSFSISLAQKCSQKISQLYCSTSRIGKGNKQMGMFDGTLLINVSHPAFAKILLLHINNLLYNLN